MSNIESKIPILFRIKSYISDAISKTWVVEKKQNKVNLSENKLKVSRRKFISLSGLAIVGATLAYVGIKPTDSKQTISNDTKITPPSTETLVNPTIQKNIEILKSKYTDLRDFESFEISVDGITTHVTSCTKTIETVEDMKLFTFNQNFSPSKEFYAGNFTIGSTVEISVSRFPETENSFFMILPNSSSEEGSILDKSWFDKSGKLLRKDFYLQSYPEIYRIINSGINLLDRDVKFIYSNTTSRSQIPGVIDISGGGTEIPAMSITDAYIVQVNTNYFNLINTNSSDVNIEFYRVVAHEYAHSIHGILGDKYSEFFAVFAEGTYINYINGLDSKGLLSRLEGLPGKMFFKDFLAVIFEGTQGYATGLLLYLALKKNFSPTYKDALELFHNCESLGRFASNLSTKYKKQIDVEDLYGLMISELPELYKLTIDQLKLNNIPITDDIDHSFWHYFDEPQGILTNSVGCIPMYLPFSNSDPEVSELIIQNNSNFECIYIFNSKWKLLQTISPNDKSFHDFWQVDKDKGVFVISFHEYLTGHTSTIRWDNNKLVVN